MTKDIFVFGSNLSGRHGKGAALYAREHHGAEYGVGEGLTGDSYALPTKDEKLRVRSLDDIFISLLKLSHFALNNPDLNFNLTPIGCGLAGYKQEDMIKKVVGAIMPNNVYLTAEWRPECIREYHDSTNRR